jgi:two-component system nitrogen regulation sensor histidine kinase NtrY
MTELHKAAGTGVGRQRGRRLSARLGPVIVILALLVAIVSFLIFADYTPIKPQDTTVLALFVANIVIIAVLIGLVVAEALALIKAWRAGVAGAKLHIRIVGLFSIIAAVPSILMALIGSATLERSLNPAFIEDVRGFILNTIDAASLFREAECKSLLQEANLTATDIGRVKVMYSADRQLFQEFFASRAKILGFTAAAMMNPDGTIVEKVDTGASSGTQIVQLEPSDFEDARKNEPVCPILDGGKTFIALRQLSAFDNTFLYVARPVDPFTVEFPKQASRLVALYDAFDAHRRSVQIAFATMYVSISLIMLLAATWLGLSFANKLVAPIRRLIAATDQVATGNLYVQVPINRSDGDLAHLGQTFNKMTSELRGQQNRLVAASNLIDERRVFTEAVLSGVPVAVVGVGPKGTITALNPSAERLIPQGDEVIEDGLVGQAVEQVFPEIEPILSEARGSHARLVQGQIALSRAGRDRLFNVRVTSEPTSRVDKSYVVTLDDITDLVSAQRTAAWADVARRIAHEIKNPLTPIQLSAERLKRKYGKHITQDRDIFDQCTDTIVRQVDDIKRMVDEFSSFARMPKARLESDDLAECLRRVLFLMRVAHPDITFEEALPETPIVGPFDRRLLSQALTNIIKNATEGISGETAEVGEPGRISVSLEKSGDLAEINIVDNGKGFPKENRHRLLEPYMTTRAEGTGLGLPIVAKILEDHGGGIELLDAPTGHGARVRLYFPLREDSHSSDAPDQLAVSQTAL